MVIGGPLIGGVYVAFGSIFSVPAKATAGHKRTLNRATS